MSLLSKLTQGVTTGLSVLGTLSAPQISPYLTNNPLPYGRPWGTDNVVNTNPYSNAPYTGVTRYYDWNVTRHSASPDGFKKSMLMVNNQFPGPTIEANWGDNIQVTVHNNINGPAEGTSLHWHGFLMHDTQYMDGTPGLTQCPIAPGDTFTYNFRAELYGSSWYHSHFAGQYANGLGGPIIIHGPNNLNYDIDLGPVMLQDYFHSSYDDVAASLLVPRPRQPPIIPTSDNNLINGKATYICPGSGSCMQSGSLAKFKFQQGKTHRLRLMNTGVEGAQQFSIDNHIMTVIANDFVPVKPYNTKVVTLGVGQRTDVLVKADQPANSYHWMRSTITCAQSRNPAARAVVYYAKSNRFDLAPQTQPWPEYTANSCQNDDLSLTVPMYPISVTDPGKQNTFVVNITAFQNSSGYYFFGFNNVAYVADYSLPTLLLSKDIKNATKYVKPASRQQLMVPTNAKSYRIILQNQNPSWHPIHLHGHNMYVLAVSGASTTWDGKITRKQNPQRRDVQQVPPNGYAVIQVDADNSGAWGLHCHMAFHSGSGLFMEVVEGSSNQLQSISTPKEVTEGCKAWKQWQNSPAGTEAKSGWVGSGE